MTVTKKTHSKRKYKLQHIVDHGSRIAQAYAYGRGASSSVTSAKKHEKMSADDVQKGITNVGYTVVVNPKIPKSVDKGRSFQYVENGQGVVTTAAGPRQVAKTIVCAGTANQALCITPALNLGLGPNLASVPYRNLNPNVFYTGSDFYQPIASGQAQQIEKVFLSKVGIDIRVCNFTTIPSEVDIYFFKATQNSNWLPDTLWNKLGVSHGLGVGIATLPAATALTGNDVGFMTNVMIGSNPFLFREFRKFFKVLKIHHINLGGGAEEKVHFQVKQNQMIDIQKILQLNTNMNTQLNASWTNANVTIPTLRGSIHIMMVARGGLVKSTEGSFPTVNGGCEIGYTFTKHHSFKTVRNTVMNLDPVVADMNIPIATATKQVSIVDTLVVPQGL